MRPKSQFEFAGSRDYVLLSQCALQIRLQLPAFTTKDALLGRLLQSAALSLGNILAMGAHVWMGYAMHPPSSWRCAYAPWQPTLVGICAIRLLVRPIKGATHTAAWLEDWDQPLIGVA